MTRSAPSWVLAAFVIANSAGAQTALLRPVPVVAQSDTTAFGRVKSRMDSLVAAGVTPSIAVAVVKDGRIVWEAAAGVADRRRGIPATPRTIYPLASVAKSITATSVMLLVERGILRLDEPVQTYVGRDLIRVYRGDPSALTVRTLLNMTAGIPHLYYHYWSDESKGPLDDTELVRRYGFSAFQPGRHFHYSNMSFGILQHVVTKASGKPFSRFVREDVFGPLGLRSSAVHLDENLVSHAAKLYLQGADTAVSYRLLDPEGGAWFLSSAHDLALFGSALTFTSSRQIARPGERVLRDATLRQMFNFGALGFYGLGWWGARQGDFLIGLADGQAVGTTATIKVLPENDAVAAALTNQAIGNEITMSIVDDLLGAILPGYADRTPKELAVPEQFRPRPFIASPEWSGRWRGSIRSHERDVSLVLNIPLGGTPDIQIANSSSVSLQSPIIMNGALEASAETQLPVAATRRVAHRLELNLRLDGRQIAGYVLAASTTPRPRFGLPFFIELTKDTAR